MATFGDALVVRILADSSELQRELDHVLGRFDELQTRVEQLAGTASQLGRLGTAISSLQTPLQSVGRLFDQVQRQADALSRTTVTLNVSPALNALATLSAAIAQVQAQLRALSVPIGTPIPVPGPAAPPTGPIRQFADGGLVDGPAGIDRVPALLTSGEFVLSRDAVRGLGVPFLQRVNERPEGLRAAGNRETTGLAGGATTMNTQFGGVTIQVQHPSELGSVMDALMLEETRLRNRRG